jgi:hypothetical protein
MAVPGLPPFPLCYEVGALRHVLLLFCFSCTGAVTTTGFTPVTSIVVRADSVIPSSQCGTAKNQIAKYTAVISSVLPDGDAGYTVGVLGGNTYACYTDAMFANLPAQSNLTFGIDVFLWSAEDYAAASSLPSIEAQLRDPAQIFNDSGVGALAQLRSLKATAVRHCTATQITSVQSVARCGPAMLLDSGVTDSGSEAGPADASSDADAGSD